MLGSAVGEGDSGARFPRPRPAASDRPPGVALRVRRLRRSHVFVASAAVEALAHCLVWGWSGVLLLLCGTPPSCLCRDLTVSKFPLRLCNKN